MHKRLWRMTVGEILTAYPYAEDFFATLPFAADPAAPVREFFAGIKEEQLKDLGLNRKILTERFTGFMTKMEEVKRITIPVRSITIIGGQDKSGQKENIRITIRTGETVCLIGPTGSGKSRLLADIEWLAQQDTPTGRKILINDQVPDANLRFSIEHKLVAQLSQNMNFVMDLTVTEFLRLHAESRMMRDIDSIIAGVIDQANRLTGERFSGQTLITALSGGQSRALMIADTAYLSSSPVVLIDEIENAGIDRQKAVRLLLDKQKIVFMATHDPILALMGDRRLIINNGKIDRIISTSEQERGNLLVLENIDCFLTTVRNRLRCGECIDKLPDLPRILPIAGKSEVKI